VPSFPSKEVGAEVEVLKKKKKKKKKKKRFEVRSLLLSCGRR